MNYKIIPTSVFNKQAKKLIKKYPSLKAELAAIGKALEINPKQGNPLGSNAYKVRISIQSKGKGKSGGARVITYLYHEGKEVYLLSIYDKSELSTISDKILIELIKSLKKDG